MSEKQETIAGIVAEMRSLVKPEETLEHTYELLNGLADRIDRIHKREVDELTEKLETARHCWKVWSDRADELRTKCDEQYAKLKMVGNTTKVREMLETIKRKAISIIPGSSIQKKMLDRFRLLAESALAAPPRNCDRFNTLEDALAGWREVSPDESGPFDDWLFAEAKGDAK